MSESCLLEDTAASTPHQNMVTVFFITGIHSFSGALITLFVAICYMR